MQFMKMFQFKAGFGGLIRLFMLHLCATNAVFYAFFAYR